MRISDWSSDVCSSDLWGGLPRGRFRAPPRARPTPVRTLLRRRGRSPSLPVRRVSPRSPCRHSGPRVSVRSSAYRGSLGKRFQLPRIPGRDYWRGTPGRRCGIADAIADFATVVKVTASETGMEPSALHYVYGQAAERCLLIALVHVEAGLAHRL